MENIPDLFHQVRAVKAPISKVMLTINDNIYFAVAKPRKMKMIQTGKASLESWLRPLLVLFLCV